MTIYKIATTSKYTERYSIGYYTNRENALECFNNWADTCDFMKDNPRKTINEGTVELSQSGVKKGVHITLELIRIETKD